MPGLQKIPKEDIMAVIAKLGPCQPIDIRKELKAGDSFLIGALLSELVGEGRLTITKVRRGGSPLYYDHTRPETLDAASQYLNEKDRRTYAMLKEQKAMREDAQEPLVRVGLKNMPDFSKPVEVDGVMYWRHYLVPEDDAVQIVKGMKTAQESPQEIKHELKEMVQEIKEMKERSVEIQEKLADSAQPKSRKEKKSAAKKENGQKDPAAAGDVPAKPKKAKKKAAEPVLMPDGAVMISPQEWLAHDTLYEKVMGFAGDAKLRDARVHKPHGELTCIASVQTPLGAIDAFVHAFNRKFTADDVKANLPRARELGLPVIVLSVDAIPSKVTAQFKGMPNIIFKRLEK